MDTVFDLKDRKDIPLSYADHVTMKNCKCECETYFNVEPNKAQYELSDFTFENLDIRAKMMALRQMRWKI